MYIKKQLKKRFLFSFISIIVIVISILGSSYALFMDVKTDVNAQVLIVGDLQVTYTGESSINIEGLDPMSDEEAFTKEDNIYTFTIENTGSVPYTYEISLVNNEEFSDKPLLNYSFIRFDFNNVGARTLGDIENNEIFKGNLEAGQTKLFNLRLWVGDPNIYNLPNAALGSEIHLKIVVDGKAGISEEITEE